MLLFVLTEAALFALLLSAYFYIRFTNEGTWPQDGLEVPELTKPIVMTVVILLAGAATFLAGRSASRGRRPALLLAATLVLGAAFVGLQAWEYVDTLELFTPQENAYASLFFTITGVHGAHVALGILLAGWALFAVGADEPGRSRTILRATALYWLFLPIAWLLIFASLYLSVRL
jgi:heme/copper-type cytochrome/quinol oxidase subunit 3